MSTPRFLGWGLIVALLLALGIGPDSQFRTSAQGPGGAAQKIGGGEGPGLEIAQDYVEVSFPSADKKETGWKVFWTVEFSNGLVIKEAWFTYKDRGTLKTVKVLGDCRVSELFVPYYMSKTNTSYFDISSRYTQAMPVTDAMVGPGPNKVLRGLAGLELRDRGVLWVAAEKGQPVRAYRGKEMVLWAPLRADWYIYLVQISFRDDGSIAFRSGSTGNNSPGETHVSHMHNTCWRLDVDLGLPDQKGKVKNTVNLVKHKEPPEGKRAVQQPYLESLFNGGVEGGKPWNAEEFTRLRVISNDVANAEKHPISYELVPLRSGTSRHHEKWDETFTRNDFWVTPADPAQMEYRKLPEYAARGRSIDNTDVVLWYTSSALHIPRDEDIAADGQPGVTMVIWSGFDLAPRDLFSASPLFTRAKKGVEQ